MRTLTNLPTYQVGIFFGFTACIKYRYTLLSTRYFFDTRIVLF
ncbi:unnamed protein product [Spodoptera littoralis]|uniref:Uncharacterized protein n=1 Tax=Spodoptera littoralis TaxID=7109 RepID=A0A9P0IDU2_SPOLI|nr:unnamed protein product [Spodoptera littoralis]CAH1644369.1 unnamed protein product [Spodoptera littoralis]